MSVRRTRTRANVSSFARAVMRAVKRIPRGRVASYGDIAAAIGSPQSARAVGSALQALPDDANAPWWRVINGRGTISPGGGLHRARLQRELLEHEGVRFDRTGRTDFATFGWRRRRRAVD